MRAPLAPMGWPRATAPPFTLTFSGLSLSWRVTAIAATAKASFSSTRSTSLSRSQPAFASSFSTASTGAIITHLGSTPLTACATMRAIGCLPRRNAVRSLVTIRAAAPSLVPGAFPAVTVAGSRLQQKIGAVGHRFHAAGHYDFRFAQLDRLCRKRDGFQAGAADFVDGHRSDTRLATSLQRGLARGILAEAGLDDVAHDDFVDLPRFEIGAANGFGHDFGSEFG